MLSGVYVHSVVIALAAVLAMSSLVCTNARSDRYGCNVAPANVTAPTKTPPAGAARESVLPVAHPRLPRPRGPALHRRLVQARSPSSRRGWPCRREYAPPVWAPPAPPLLRPRLRVRKQRQVHTLSCADETGPTVYAVSRVRLRLLRRPC